MHRVSRFYGGAHGGFGQELPVQEYVHVLPHRGVVLEHVAREVRAGRVHVREDVAYGSGLGAIELELALGVVLLQIRG